jgi:GMP synthase (glutamine-hydrolysing)
MGESVGRSVGRSVGTTRARSQPPGRVVVVEHETGAGLDLMDVPLRAGVALDVVRPYRDERLPELGPQVAALIVLGGAMGAWDDDVAPWLPATRALMADAVRAQVPTLGICLGAQLLAAATGGQVDRGPAGLELGTVTVTPTATAPSDPFFGPLVTRLGTDGWAVHQYHYDAVTALPPDADLLVTGDLYPVQGYRVGAAAWGVQYHPEVSVAGFVQWVRDGSLPPDTDAVLTAIRAGEQTQMRTATAHSNALLSLMTGPVTIDGPPGSRDTLSS